MEIEVGLLIKIKGCLIREREQTEKAQNSQYLNPLDLFEILRFLIVYNINLQMWCVCL